MNAKVLLLAPWAVLVALPFGCGGEDEAGGCVAGQSIACTGERGCAGHQVCKQDGSAYSPCLCGDDPVPDGGFDEMGPRSGRLGAMCNGEAGCRPGLTCLPSTSVAASGQGPANGICTADCRSDESVCAQFDPKSVCQRVDVADRDSAAYCFAGCSLGEPGFGADKCRGRSDLACSETAAGSGEGYCRPSCQNDAHCGSRFCNLSTGLCGDARPSGDPVGAACAAEQPNCAGACLPHGGYAECSGACTLGAVGCGESREEGPPYDVYCLLEPSTASALGDLGYCAKLCDCDAQCGRADAVCQPLAAQLRSETGRKGSCASKTFVGGSTRPGLPCE